MFPPRERGLEVVRLANLCKPLFPPRERGFTGGSPEANQIVLENRSEIESLWFRSMAA